MADTRRAGLERLGFGVALAGLTAAALGLRAAGLDPPSLWLDDQWMALAVRDLGFGQLLAFGTPVPLGFVALEKLAHHLSADPEWPLQLLPVLASAAQVPVAALLARRLTGRKSLALLAAALVLVDPLQVVFAARVKPYPLDTLTTLGVLYFGLPLLERWETRRALALAAGAFAALWVSFPCVFVSAPLLHLAWLFAWRRKEASARSPPALAALAGFDVALLAVYLLVLRAQGSPTVREYWAANYLPLGAGAFGFLADQGLASLRTLLPAPIAGALALVPVGLFSLSREPKWRPLAVLCAVFYLELVAASALRLYPLGGGRTDAFAQPVTLVLLLAGLEALAGWLGAARSAGGVYLGAAALVLVFAQPTGYPPCGDAAVVQRAAQVLEPDDGLLVYPHAAFAVAYYGPWPAQAVASPDFAQGFGETLSRPGARVLPGRGAYWEHPENLDPELGHFLSQPHRRILYLVGGWPKQAAHQAISARLAGAGWRPAERLVVDDSALVVYERAP